MTGNRIYSVKILHIFLEEKKELFFCKANSIYKENRLGIIYMLGGIYMKKYNNIIVPTDGSENSKRALEHAVVIASSLGATITLVYVANIVSVISNFDQIPNASGYVTEQVALDMEEEGKGVLNEFAKQIPQNLEVKSVFEVGSPGPAVLSVAKKYNADLIVMGSRGLGPLKGLFMGSVSSYVVSHSVCPVLIVK